MRIYQPGRAILTSAILSAEAVVPGRLERAKAWLGLSEAFKRRDFVEYSKRLDALRMQEAADWRSYSPVSQALTGFVRTAVGASANAGMQADEWFRSLQAVGDRLLTGGGSHSLQEGLMQRILRYVDLNYMRDIGIGKLADEFGLTPNYLSTVFHKRQGVTFVKYLTATRMIKAKELLVTRPELKVNQVAKAVGYFSTRHFTKLFVEHFGAYPSEIREKTAEG